jgi:CAAX prenyl protease-like protein
MAGEDGERPMIGANIHERAYIGPFCALIALFAVGALVQKLFEGQSAWWVATPEYWVYPLQVLIPAALLYYWRPLYQSSPPRRISWSVAIGLIALGVWLAPQLLLHVAARVKGFDPGHFGPGLPYALNLTLRLARAIVVVPIVEELFWRGFLLRFVVDPDFTKVPIGAYTRLSFWIVTLGFIAEHQRADWPAAALTGMLYNLVAYRTGSLGSCIVAHAVTNAALAGYILYSGQFGFW